MHATSRSFLPLALVVAVVAGGQAHAVTIDWVTVGDPGNANDPATGNQHGAVGAEYRIMKFEWTNTQYAAFLNAIDPNGTNPNSVYNSSMSSDDKGGITNTGSTNGSRYATKANMGDKPVNFVNWWDAARVANWLHNGAQTYGSTDATAGGPQNTGAYTTGTATTGSVAPLNAGALYRVPSEDEWYKAAFFNPTLNAGAGGYTIYGNGFSAAPTPVAATLTGSGSAGSVGNFANYLSGAVWNGQTGNVTTVGTNGAASYYGAYDMSGNLWEWNDLAGTGGSTVGVFGGDFGTTLANVSSSGGSSAAPPAFEGASNGFRLASAVPVPEPSTSWMALAGLACGGFSMWRRRKQA